MSSPTSPPLTQRIEQALEGITRLHGTAWRAERGEHKIYIYRNDGAIVATTHWDSVADFLVNGPELLREAAEALRSAEEELSELDERRFPIHLRIGKVRGLKQDLEAARGEVKELREANEKRRYSIELCPLTHSYLLPDGKHLTHELAAALGEIQEGHQ